MKRLPLLACLLVPLLSGCAIFSKTALPADRIAAAEEAFTTIVDTLNYLRASGYINDADQIQVNRIEHAVSAGFDSIHADLAAGRTIDATAFLRGVRASMNQLTIYQKAAEDARRRSPPVGATRPAQPARVGNRDGAAWRRLDRRAA